MAFVYLFIIHTIWNNVCILFNIQTTKYPKELAKEKLQISTTYNEKKNRVEKINRHREIIQMLAITESLYSVSVYKWKDSFLWIINYLYNGHKLPSKAYEVIIKVMLHNP